jgi:DNA-binding NtrC family response regulator
MGAILTERLVLIVEDELLIAMDLAQTFERAGARVTTTNSLREALQLVESDNLAAAVLDHALRDGNSLQLCERLKERDIPFVLYSGHSEIESACHGAPFVAKPSKTELLVSMVEELLTRRSNPT